MPLTACAASASLPTSRAMRTASFRNARASSGCPSRKLMPPRLLSSRPRLPRSESSSYAAFARSAYERALDVLARSFEIAPAPVAARAPGEHVRAQLVGGDLGALSDLQRFVEQS